MKYVIVQHGVYQHGTWGPFDTLKEACDRARVCAAADSDCYHEWAVHPIDPVNGLGDKLGHLRKNCGPKGRCGRGDGCLGLKHDLPE